MIQAIQKSLYDQVVDVTQYYLGPAADRFIARQIRNHLHKEPEALTSGDIADLVDWVKVAIAVLTEDTKLINEFAQKLLRLSSKGI